MASASVSAPTTRGFRSAKRVSDKRLQPNSTAAAKPVTYAFWGRARRQQDAPARSDKIAVMPRISQRASLFTESVIRDMTGRVRFAFPKKLETPERAAGLGQGLRPR